MNALSNRLAIVETKLCELNDLLTVTPGVYQNCFFRSTFKGQQFESVEQTRRRLVVVISLLKRQMIITLLFLGRGIGIMVVLAYRFVTKL